jgi:hypothetical protein
MTLAAIEPRTDADARCAQVNALALRRQHDSSLQQALGWIQSQKSSVRLISQRKALAGSLVMDMPGETAETMRRQLEEDLHLIEDGPVALIRPTQSANAKIASCKPEDCWHFEAIGLSEARRINKTAEERRVTIAVLDTGADPHHPEIAQALVHHVSFDVNQWSAFDQLEGFDSGVKAWIRI